MRRTVLVLALATVPSLSAAQRDTSLNRQSLPRDVRREVEDRWNAASGLRASSRVEVEGGREIRGDVAVQNGPLLISGHVTGSVLAVNSDVVLRPTARIDGDLLVVGGEVEGRNTAYVGGEIRIYRQALQYVQRGDSIIAERANERDEDEGWWRRLERRNTLSWSDPVRIAQAGPYNRVEGLPVSVGPSILARRQWGSFRIDAAAVVRTASSFGSSDSDIGHSINAEVRAGQREGVGIGARAFNTVDGVEDWQLSDLEVALASFLVHRDYRDYYQRHGASAYVTLFSRGSDVTFTGSFSDERWTARTVNDPFTLFNNNDDWRPNPLMDEGKFHLANARLLVDTRTDPDDPWSGWYIDADFEGGKGRLGTVAPSSPLRAPGGDVTYTRGFLDLRRYNRLSPEAQVNLRVVVGGWLNGDPLPLQRRMSVDGPGALPGFDFRSGRAGVDVGTCGGAVPIYGQPTQCERIALGQIEYRGDFSIDFDGFWDDGPHYRRRAGRATGAWVLFADAGRGWKVSPTTTGDGLNYARTVLPPLSTFRTDVGVGVDFGGIGVYCAKSISAPSEPANFFFRLRHRF